MITPEIVRNIALDFLGKLQFTKSAKGQLKLGTTFLEKTQENAAYDFLIKQAQNIFEDHKKTYPTLAASFLFNPEFSRSLLREISSQYDKKKIDINDSNIKEIRFNDSILSPLCNLKIIYNVFTVRHSVVYDTETDRVYEYDFDFVNKHLKLLLDDGLGQYLASNSEQCHFAYVPFAPRLSTQKEYGIEHQTFNLWTEAPWSKGWKPDPLAKLPEVISRFLKSLIEDETDRHYFLAWLRDATFGKADPILILCGNPGVGKNIIAQNLVSALVGQDNVNEAPRGFGSQFNSNVGGCRLFFMDEMELTPKIRDNLKSFHNGKQALERKGIDVGKPVRVPASFILANNSEQYIKLEYTDRKFFTPYLSPIPLLEKMVESEVDEMVKSITTDIEFIRDIASYLFHNFKQGESRRFKKSEFFEKLCIQSYPYPFKRFMLMCENYANFSHKMFSKVHKKPYEPFELQSKINEYTTTFKRPLAKLDISATGEWTATSLIYKPSVDKSEEMSNLI